jgi:hypothetical protein
LASAEPVIPDRVVVVVVWELGPVIRVGMSALVKGSTVVVLEVRLLNTHSRNLLVNDRIHWENGGTFVIKGVKTLEHDMSNALEAALAPNAVAQ